MSERELKELQELLKDQQRQISDLRRDLQRESSNTTAHIEKIHELIVRIHEYLWPLVRKTFPNFYKDIAAIDRLTKNSDPGKGRRS